MIELMIDARRKDLGGFEVGRILPFAKHRMVGPFVFLDHMGPAEFQPGFDRSADVRPHPHIGLSTVTYLFSGEITHRDSLGVRQNIVPGEVNWMTAGKGITHSERFERLRSEGGRIEGLQAWVALPAEHEDDDPAFAHHDGEDLPVYDSGDGLWARLVAGSGFGATARVKTHSPMVYVHWELKAGAKGAFPPEYPERAAYVAKGSVEIDGRTIEAGRMAVLSPGATVVVTALTDATVMLLGGEPVGERFLEWNFVASSKDRLEQAKADWRAIGRGEAGRFALPPEDAGEWIPLPEPSPPPNPMS